MHDASIAIPKRGLRKVRDDISQFNDVEPAPPLTMTQESACKTELFVLVLHCLVWEWQVFAHEDVGGLRRRNVWSWVLKAEY